MDARRKRCSCFTVYFNLSNGFGSDSDFYCVRYIFRITIEIRLKTKFTDSELFESGPRPSAMALSSLSFWSSL